MTPEGQILDLLKSWAPEINRLLTKAGYFDLPRDSTQKSEIAKAIGLDKNGKLYKQVLAASKEKNSNISQIVLNEISLREFKAGARKVAQELNIPFSQWDWNDGAQNYFDKEGLKLVTEMSQTDIDSLRQRVQYDFNLEPKAFADRYADSYSCSPARLERIKRSETHTAGQDGGFQFASDAGAGWKQWMCTPRGIYPRSPHREIWYEVVPIDEAFSNGQMYPSDPNCRCYLIYLFDPSEAKHG